MGTKIVESGVGTIASGKSVSLSTLHLQIGCGCSTLSTLERKNFQIGKVSASQQVELYRFLILFDLCKLHTYTINFAFQETKFWNFAE